MENSLRKRGKKRSKGSKKRKKRKTIVMIQKENRVKEVGSKIKLELHKIVLNYPVLTQAKDKIQ